MICIEVTCLFVIFVAIRGKCSFFFLLLLLLCHVSDTYNPLPHKKFSCIYHFFHVVLSDMINRSYSTGQLIQVLSDQQKSIGVIFRTSRSGSDVRNSCHHNSSHFSFPVFAHSWCFSVFHSLNQSHRVYIN